MPWPNLTNYYFLLYLMHDQSNLVRPRVRTQFKDCRGPAANYKIQSREMIFELSSLVELFGERIIDPLRKDLPSVKFCAVGLIKKLYARNN